MRLKDVVRINQSSLPDTTDPDYLFKYIDISSVNRFGDVAIPDAATTFSAAPSRARRLAPPGATVVSTVRTYLRAIGRVPDGAEHLVFSTGFAVLEAGPLIDPGYLYYLCRSEPFIQHVGAYSVGVSYPAINPNDLGLHAVDLPSIEDQQRIAARLDRERRRFEALRGVRTRQLELLGQKRSSLLAECLSGDILGLRSDVQHPILGRVPFGARVLPLKRVVPEITVGVVVNPSSYFADEGVHFVHGYNVRDGWLDLSDVKRIDPSDSARLRKSRLQGGDVLVVRAGAPGRAAVVPDELEGSNCASVLVLKRGKLVIPEFLAAFFNGRQGRGQVVSSQYGAAQEVISVAQVKEYFIALPGLDDQRNLLLALSKQMREVDRMVDSLGRQIELIDERWRAIVTALVTGQVDPVTAREVHV